METVGFLHLFTQSIDELEEKAIYPPAFVILEEIIKMSGHLITFRKFIELAEVLTKSFLTE